MKAVDIMVAISLIFIGLQSILAVPLTSDGGQSMGLEGQPSAPLY